MPIYEWDEDTQAIVIRSDSFPYRSKWACFTCRKSFTRIRQSYDAKVKCPDCSSQATDMGHLFEPPPKSNRRAWEVAEILGNYGFGYRRASSKYFIRQFFTDGDTLPPKLVRCRVEKYLGKHYKKTKG